MASRIDQAVIRGELDNRMRGCVKGRIWLLGRAEPVELKLKGNCWSDLAGRRLEFTNPDPQPMELGNLAALQQGVVGDITASRRVKVPDIPLDQVGVYYASKTPFPWHWANALYLEWYGERNGRVVIEAVTFSLRIIGEPTWEMSEADEQEQRQANGEALTDFMERLEAAGRDVEIVDDTPAEWNAPPQTEEEAEQQQARGERLADRIQARLDREGPAADYEKILEEEIERMQREHGGPEPTPEEQARRAAWIEEINRAGEEALAHPDPEVEAELNYEHPLVKRATELSEQMDATAQAESWLPEHALPEHPVAELLNATMIAGPKLAGALNGRYWPPEVEFCAHTIVQLKRARGYIEDALGAAESCQEEKLIKPEHLGPIVVELTDLAREADALIDELRTKLERGTD